MSTGGKPGSGPNSESENHEILANELPKIESSEPTESASPPPHLGQMLVERQMISEKELAEAMIEHQQSGEFLGKVLVEKGLLTEQQIIQVLSEQLDRISTFNNDPVEEFEDESEIEISKEAIDLVPPEMAIKANAVPISLNKEKKILNIAVVDSRDMTILDEIRFKTGLNIQMFLVSQAFLEEAWATHYHWTGERATSRQTELLQKDFRSFAQKLNNDEVNPFISRMLSKAHELGASDVHIDPFERQVTVRFRIDGQLYTAASFAKRVYANFIGRLKVMANVDIGERKNAIDSRLLFKDGEKQIEYRVSILKGLYGERVVLRVQRDSNEIPRLNNIHLPKIYVDQVKQKIQSPNGLIIVTGPTGSGKSTTLYAMLNELCDMSRNVMTIEDPVELTLTGASQINVEKDLTFSDILRSVLRQDPDVIMVGEIRDEETAQIAVRAAMTGHLVFCSLHTNDALSAITRLEDMKVPPYYIAPALNLLMAQRLIRLLCEDCKKPGRYSKQVLLELGFTPNQIRNNKFYRSSGCSSCNMTGFQGRVPIFEMVNVKQGLRDAISRGEPLSKLRAIAKKTQYVPFSTLLREYLRRGKTSVEEAMPYLID